LPLFSFFDEEYDIEPLIVNQERLREYDNYSVCNLKFRFLKISRRQSFKYFISSTDDLQNRDDYPNYLSRLDSCELGLKFLRSQLYMNDTHLIGIVGEYQHQKDAGHYLANFKILIFYQKLVI
jgi:hypothetical protein